MRKLSESEMLSIQRSYRAGEPIAAIAARFGVAAKVVRMLVAGERVASEWPPPWWKDRRP